MKLRMRLSVGCLLMMAAFALSSCSKSEEEKIDDAWELSGCGFDLSWTRNESDHAKVLKTTVAYSWESEEGEVIELDDASTGSVVKESKKVPNVLTITITKELRPEIDLTADVSYKLSFGYYLKIESYIVNSITGQKLPEGCGIKDGSTSVTVAAKNLAKIYPETTTLKYYITKDGEVMSEADYEEGED